MKVSLNWLADFIDVSPIRKDLSGILHQLTMRGLEVEGVHDLSKGLDKVVVAQVVKKDAHPNASKLSLCQVNDGKETLQIVCGAQNFKAGDKVCLSKIGAELPNGMKIGANKIRDVESFGMLCSEEELGFKESAEGILILPTDAPLGTPIAEFLKKNDVVIEINVTPNRGDALSIRGVARELASILGQELKEPKEPLTEAGAGIGTRVKIDLQAKDTCYQYTARLIENIKVGASPDWMVSRLEACGMRSISNVVDITNYVMLEYGLPLHAFDFDQLKGEGSQKVIRIRKAHDGEKIKLLDDTVAELRSGVDMVIADANVAIAIAGVMGGFDSEVTEKTKNILLEAAHFDASAVRKTAKHFQKNSEASHRFERMVDSQVIAKAMERAASLLQKYCGGTVASGVAKGESTWKYQEDKIRITVKDLNLFLGTNLSVTDVVTALKKAGFTAAAQGDALEVTLLSYRPDVKIAEDVYEEVLRVWGYDKVQSVIPALAGNLSAAGSLNSASNLRQNFVQKTKSLMASFGFCESMNFAFTSVKRASDWTYKSTDEALLVQLKNPLNEEFTTLRTSLLGGLFESLLNGFHHQQKEMKFFELRPVYYRDEKSETGVREEWRLAGIITGRAVVSALAAQDRDVDFYDMKAVVETLCEALGVRGLRYQELAAGGAEHRQFHPYQSVKLVIGPGACGVMGRIHPSLESQNKIRQPVLAFEISFDQMFKMAKTDRKFQAISKFPKVLREFSLLVPNSMTSEKVLMTIQKLGKPLVDSVQVVDLFEGGKIPAGYRSLSFAMTWSDPNRTLEEQEIDALQQKLVAGLDKELQVRLRTE